MSTSIPTNFNFEPIEPTVIRPKNRTPEMMAELNSALIAFKSSVLSDSVPSFLESVNLLHACGESVFSVEVKFPRQAGTFIRMSLLECAMMMGAPKVAAQIINLGLQANDRESARELRHIGNCIGKGTGTPEILATYEEILLELLRPRSEDHAIHMLKQVNTHDYLQDMGPRLQAIHVKAATAYLSGLRDAQMSGSAGSGALH